MMERETRFHFYSGFAKMSTLVLQMLCVAGFVISVVLAGYVMNTVGSMEDLTEKSAYEGTAGFGAEAAQAVYEKTEYAKYKSWFETDGEYDQGKKIDITKPDETDVKKMDESTTYSVSQLRNILKRVNEAGMGFSNVLDEWNYNYYDNYGYYYYDDSQDGYYDAEGYYQGETVMENAAVATSPTKEETEILRGLYNSGKRLEIELPASGKTLADQALEQQSIQYLTERYEHMSRVLDGLGIYMKSRNTDKDINVKYYVRDTDTGVIDTNVPEWEGKAEGITEKDLHEDWLPLVSYTRDNGRISYDASAGDSQAQKYMQNFFRNTSVLGDNEQMVVAVDTSYPFQDTFRSNYEWYTTYQPKFRFLAASAILTFLIGMACFVIATIQTGRKERGGEITLTGFDRLPVEIALAIAFIAGTILFGVGFGVFPVYQWARWEAVLFAAAAAAIAIVCAAFFMGVYLSFVRRIKSKTFWKNSVTNNIIKMCRRVYDARKISGKIIIVFVIFILLHLILIGLFRAPGAFLVIIVDILALLYLIKEGAGRQAIKEGLIHIAEGDLEYKIDITTLQGENKEMAEHVNRVGDGLQSAMEKSMKNERLKAELITNVSHDIKTPLTSIINYVDLLKREELQDDKVRGYIGVLDAKSQRLKQLTDDLIEASKVSTGNIELQMTRIQVQQMLQQAYGEFDEKLSEKGLQTILNLTEEPVIILADGRQLWRIFENLLHNIAKYAMPNTRVYIDLQERSRKAVLTFKNMSEYPLNISADELTERFTRGDDSRSTEGSGLGLSIAKSLTELQQGGFEIYLDGDLFKVTITFDMM